MFQPTPSSRRETISLRHNTFSDGVSTHSLLAEGDVARTLRGSCWNVSTHSLLAEGDDGALRELAALLPVSTHSLLAEGDVPAVTVFVDGIVSTHSLLAEGDSPARQPTARRTCFNPLPPRGGRLGVLVELLYVGEFQPTPSSRRETSKYRFASSAALFQPTPSSRRETARPILHDRNPPKFQPTPSSRRETR